MSNNEECSLQLVEGLVLIVINVLLVVIGTFGNVLTILAVLKTPQLRQRPSNFLLLSLAVADVLVTTISQPFTVAIFYLKTFPGQCNSVLELLYTISVSLPGCSSVFHLSAISIDRAISMVKPFQHRDIIAKWLKRILGTCWAISVAFTIFNSLWFQEGRKAISVIFFACFLTMAISYGIILYKIKYNNNIQSTQDNGGARDRIIEKRVSCTVAIVILLYLGCWLPLVGYTLLQNTDAVLYAGVRTLYLANSSMNFVVYSLRIRAFRVAYLRLMRKMQRQIAGGLYCCGGIGDATSESHGTTEFELNENTGGHSVNS
ncbi:adenosine receptor A2a [Exaiptasia diaphana]|uniref:G-protein coupled receptors family 1 profile domain-containing protein n=1 Tax=Exaiptasia diaphana TaxID=2652724 RepID=A0A913Y0P9_EXADI|nr:adenosine receptor A2a [Exaiptasia diaphana]